MAGLSAIEAEAAAAVTMKFNEQMTVTATRGQQQRSSDGDDVRWTDFYGISGQQSSRNLRRSSRKSAKLEHRRQSANRKPEVSEDSTSPSPFQCSRVPTLSSVTVDGSSSSVSDASSWRTLRWHRYQWVAVVYIVAVVLVGAISEVHCDAASSSVSSEGSSSSSSRLQVNREDQRGTSGNQVDDGHFLEDHYEGGGHYTHHWAVHIPEGGLETVEQVAQEHGFINHGKIQ